MKKYWNDRLEPLAEITKLPDERLINAYKSGYIYTLIIADGYSLHIGENGYDRAFDHDIIGIMATLSTIGDFENVSEYAKDILSHVQYEDARWKYSFPFAVYHSKTGDIDYIREIYDSIKENTHYIESQSQTAKGIMMSTQAVDSNGYWLVDNWSALMGLTSYKYLCDELFKEFGDSEYKDESVWAEKYYYKLLAATEKVQRELREEYDYPYLSIDMGVPTELSSRSDPRDANWASMFLFGRWAWDGYLFNADQENSEMIELIDDTYTHGFDRRKSISDTIYNFGGYPHGYYSSSYNAGYGSTALRAEQYRDMGIKAYQFMIENSMSGPFGWWEGISDPNEESQWSIKYSPGGGGSCQHMWGQSTSTKILFDSLIAEKIGEKIIIGRGIPTEWIADGKEIEIEDYSVCKNKKVGYNLLVKGKTVNITFTGDKADIPFSIELISFKDNIESVSVGEVDETAGIVVVPAGTKKVTVTLKKQ